MTTRKTLAALITSAGLTTGLALGGAPATMADTTNVSPQMVRDYAPRFERAGLPPHIATMLSDWILQLERDLGLPCGFTSADACIM